MLVANIELWPYGGEQGKRTLVEVRYWNTGEFPAGSDYGNYEYVVHVYETTDDALVRARPENYDRDELTATIRGSIVHFPRRALGSAHLLARVLTDAGFNAELAD